MDKILGKVIKKGEQMAPIKSIKIKFQKKKRSSVKPVTKADKKLSIAHLKDSIQYNKRHISDHKKLEKHGGSKEYNEAHIKGHEKALKKDKKLLEKRTKTRQSTRKLLRGMRGYKK